MERKPQRQIWAWMLVLAIYSFIVVLFLWIFSKGINTDFAWHIDHQRQNSVSRMVQLAYNAADPLIEQVRNGEISSEKAQKKISDLVREMTYEDEFGSNYIFMSIYNGTMLVQPYDPDMEGTDQWLLQDAAGRYIIQDLAHAAKLYPRGSFVTYDYYLPDHSATEEKLSFVIGIPEIEAYIGTGMYVESTYRMLEATLDTQRAGYLAMTIFILGSLLLYAWILLKSNQRLQKEMQERSYAEDNLWTVFDTIHDAILIHDERGRILHSNKQACIMYHLNRDEILNYKISDISADPNISTQWLKEIDDKIESMGFIVFEWKTIRPLDGTALDVEIALRKTQWSGHHAYVAAVRDITERKQHMEKIHRLAYFDSLTNLPNRANMMNALQEKLAQYPSAPCTAFFIDIDNFKAVNDTHGHSFGDLMLVEIAGRLDTLSSPHVTLFRPGGDEFLILSTNAVKDTEIAALGHQILGLFKEAIRIHNISFNITCSVGVAVYPKDGRTTEELLKYADLAIYKAKNQGRDRYVLYENSMVSELSSRIELETRLRAAYKNREFILHYQPQVAVEGGKIMGIEALIRWNSAPDGLISPQKFIYVAEEMGLINEIGQWVIESSFAFARSLMHTGICVSCNVSPVQLKQSDFVENVIETFDRFGLQEGSVALEITESCLVDFRDTHAKLAALRSHGIMIYLDDFGTGYSSLNYMKSLPIDVLKIDKSFIDNITENGVEGQIVQTIISLAREIGLKVIAEGVEEQGQQTYLNACGCNAIQGYLFSKPVPEAEILTLISLDAEPQQNAPF